jgi:transcriptional regulator with PAS, ATPase and Fis domain
MVGSCSAVRGGLLQDVRGGTLFLDEIDALPLEIQALLLRVFEAYEGPQPSNFAPALTSIRIVAATRTDLLRAVDEGAFRADLYYRLTAMTIRMPPLREHPEDIEDLSMNYLENCNRTYMTDIKGIDSAALALLCAYSWPGNVRELRDVIERAAMADNSAIVKASSIQLLRQCTVQ